MPAEARHAPARKLGWYHEAKPRPFVDGFFYLPEGVVSIADGRMARMALLLMTGLVVLYGCGRSRPLPAELIGPETMVLLQTAVGDGIAVLGQRSLGDKGAKVHPSSDG